MVKISWIMPFLRDDFSTMINIQTFSLNFGQTGERILDTLENTVTAIFSTKWHTALPTQIVKSPWRHKIPETGIFLENLDFSHKQKKKEQFVKF